MHPRHYENLRQLSLELSCGSYEVADVGTAVKHFHMLSTIQPYLLALCTPEERSYHSSNLVSSDLISSDLISSEPSALRLVAATANGVVRPSSPSPSLAATATNHGALGSDEVRSFEMR